MESVQAVIGGTTAVVSSGGGEADARAGRGNGSGSGGSTAGDLGTLHTLARNSGILAVIIGRQSTVVFVLWRRCC